MSELNTFQTQFTTDTVYPSPRRIWINYTEHVPT